MNFVITVELIPLVNKALDKNGRRIYDFVRVILANRVIHMLIQKISIIRPYSLVQE